jgi:serine/threonine protein phosphatase PrpC
MAAFFGVFDGHDGARAAEYCHKGLLPHILSETQYCIDKQRGGSKVESSTLETGIINAFHYAQTRFGNKMSPPTFQDVENGVKATRFDNKGSIARIMSGTVPRKRKPRGGTTALTLSIVSKQRI